LELIRFFTAQVKPFKDPQQPFRQQIYWRALRSLGTVEITEGFFKVKERVQIRVIPPLPDGTSVVTTRISNEKGSDVNLASYLLHDAFHARYELAVIVSNDADFIVPVQLVKNDFGKTVWLLKPRSHQSSDLEKYVDHILPPIDAPTLAACQFPDPILLPNGKTLRRPAEWDPALYTPQPIALSTKS